MNSQSIKFHDLLKFVAPASIIICSFLISKLASLNPTIALGITLDLTILSPIIYLLMIRNTNIPKITAAPIFIIGIFITYMILPTNLHNHLTFIINYILPIVELSVISFIVYTAIKISKAYKNHAASHHSDPYKLIQESAKQVIGVSQFTSVLYTEISLVTYALFIWAKPKPSKNQFTNYLDNGIISLFGVIIFIIGIETFIVHFLFHQWNETIIWILTIGSIYGGLQIFAHIKALTRRFTEITENQLIIKYGLFGDAEIDLSLIKKIECTSNDMDNTHFKIEKLALLKDFEYHNVAIYFHENIQITKAYGLKKQCNVLLLNIDNKTAFINMINERIVNG